MVDGGGNAFIENELLCDWPAEDHHPLFDQKLNPGFHHQYFRKGQAPRPKRMESHNNVMMEGKYALLIAHCERTSFLSGGHCSTLTKCIVVSLFARLIDRLTPSRTTILIWLIGFQCCWFFQSMIQCRFYGRLYYPHEWVTFSCRLWIPDLIPMGPVMLLISNLLIFSIRIIC